MSADPLEADSPSGSLDRAPWLPSATTLVVAALVFWISFDHGTYDVVSQSSTAIVVWWVLLLALGVWPSATISKPAAAIGGVLAAWAVLSLISAAWAPAVAPALAVFDQISLYAGVFLLVVVVARPRLVVSWLNGLALGVVAVGLLALASRLLPRVVPSYDQFSFLPSGITRLSYPVGYWNALATLLAMGLLLVLRVSLRAERSWARVAAAAAVPLLAATLYLTSSRNGFLALGVGLLVFLVAADRPLRVVVAACILGAGSVFSAWWLGRHAILVNGPFVDVRVVTHAGLRVVPVLLGAAAASAAAWWPLSDPARDRLPRSPRSDRAVVVLVLLAVVAAVVASNPKQRFESFKQPAPAAVQQNYVNTHLFSANGNGRWTLWSSAVGEFEAHPLIGGGSGSFRRWWDRHRPVLLYVENAHSLYAETLGELGLVGGVLVAALVVLVLGTFVRGLRGRRGAERDALAAAGAAAVAFLIAVGLDWVWQVGAVAMVGVAVLAVLATAASGERWQLFRRRQTILAAVPVLAAGVAVIVLHGLPMLANLKITASQSAVRSGNIDEALARANSARELTPWDSGPYLQLALIDEQVGNLSAARAWIEDAISHDPQNADLWLVRVRMETRAGDIAAARRSLARLRQLDPLSVPS